MMRVVWIALLAGLMGGLPMGCRTCNSASESGALLSGVSRIAFLGDSLTDGSSYPDYVVNTLRREFPARRFEMVNAGVCGNTAQDLEKRLDQDVIERRPDLAVICIGVNNSGDQPAAFKASLTAIVERLNRAHCKVLLMLPSHLHDSRMEAGLQKMMAAIREVAAEQRVALGDAHSEFQRWEKAGKRVIGPDGIHHGPDGFACMATAVLAALGLPDAKLRTAIAPWPNLLTNWEESASIAFDGHPGSLDPAKAADWTPYAPEAWLARLDWSNQPFVQRGAWLPFHDQPASEKIARFGRVIYTAEKAGVVELQVGGGRKMSVWVNGVKPGVPTKPRYHPDAERVRIAVKQGRNEIVVWCDFMAFVGIRAIDPAQARR